MMEYPMVHSLKLRTWCRKLGELAEGVKPGVSLAAGAFCEFSLAVVLNLAILYSMSEPLSSTHFADDQAVHLLLLPCEFQAYMPLAYI
jgi:hypothetical protein